MSSRKNKFSSALRHLNSSQIDEKIKKLEEQPTNNTSGIYTLSPPDPAADPTVYTPSFSDITILTPDFAIGEDPDNATQAADTSGLFNAEGVSLTAAPPGDNSYILGPMSTMYYAWASRTQIGYIRQSDRRMVNLGYISGNFGDWDGSEAAFNSYGQLTLEQAQWYRTIGKKDGADNSTENYRAFYPGPPSSVADAYGRYLCTITGDPKDIDNSYASSTTGPKNGPMNPNDNFSSILNRLKKLGQKINWDTVQSALKAGQKIADVLWSGAEILSKAQLGELIADLTFNPLIDAAFGFGTADSAGEYNTTLATSLMATVVTGKNQQIKLSADARQDLVNSIDIKALEQNLQLGAPPEVSSDNAINPGSGKNDNLLSGNWGNQGGVEIHYNPDNGSFTVTAVKMLRDFGDLDQKNASGKITNFHDIPNPSPKQIAGIIEEKGLEKPIKALLETIMDKKVGGIFGPNVRQISNAINSLTGGVMGLGWEGGAYGTSKEEAAQIVYDEIPGVTKAIYNFIVEGSASNAVHLRDQLIKIGIPQSEIEKAGAGFGGYVYSQEQFFGGELPLEVKKVINKKMDVYLGFATESTILSESKKIRIMKTLKEPVVLPEGKKKSYKVRPGRRGKTDFKGMDKLIGDTKIEKTFKEPQDIWNKDWHGYNQRVSQGKKNIVLELIGQSTDAFDYMLNDSKKMNAKQMEEFWGLHPEMHSHFHNGKKYKTLRKEQLKGDRLVFLVDEKGVKTSILQSKLNDQLAQKHDQELLDEYNKLNSKKEPIEYKKDPLIKKVMGRLKNEIDYPDKPARKGYPNEPPPKMVNGMHPKLGKNYKYDKLDPVSAVMMSRAPTGDPEIDANVRKAARKPK